MKLGKRKTLHKWSSQDAKAKFPQLVREAEQWDQLITNRNHPVAVVISKKRYDALTEKSGALLDFFKQSPLQEIEIKIKRSKDIPREIQL